MKKFKLSSHIPVDIRGGPSSTDVLMEGAILAIRATASAKFFKYAGHSIVTSIHKQVIQREILAIRRLIKNAVFHDVMKEEKKNK